MKQFDEWFSSHPRNSGNDNRFRNKEGMRMAYKAGMLASADIAERMYFTHTPDDGVISGAGVAVEIRKRANDI